MLNRARRPQEPPTRRRWERWTDIGLGAFVVLLVVTIEVTNRNFWFDEAMVYQAVAGQGWLAPGQPMALFEQTMPYGVYVLDKLLVDAFGLNEIVLRLPSLIAFVVGILALRRAARMIETALGRLCAVLAGGLAMWVVWEAGMFKHYAFEYAAGALILATGVTLVRERFSTRALGWFFAVSVLALPFSNTAVIATASVGATAVLISWVADRPALVRARLPLVLLGGGYLAVFLLSYLLVVKPAAVYQLSLPVYDSVGLGALVNGVLSIYAPTGKPLFLLFGTAVLVVVAAGAVVGRRRDAEAWYPYLVLVAAMAAMAVATVLGLSPFSKPRHVLFVTPAIGLALGSAVSTLQQAVAGWTNRSTVVRLLAVGLVAASVAGVLGVAFYGAARRQEEVGRVLAAGDAACSATYTAYSYQPAAQMYVARDRLGIELEGLVPTRSGLGSQSWLQQVRDNMPAYQARAVDYFRREGSGCLLSGPRPAKDDLLVPLQQAGISCAPIERAAGIGLYRCAA
ncbi:hypothetical protein [Angustibacter luteus]|uniref:Glycosyltransferase RgtA/B/C/D-like domain-containing protein n=1 Tax=Angustibacter luteus TaxID=658456 RepID=A0ABW1JBI7_9ACTN